MITQPDEIRSSPLNRLAWQGWQIDLPADWNPSELTGDERAGRAVVADLERVRFSVAWKRIRHAGSINLDRLTRHRQNSGLQWQAVRAAGRGFIEGRRAVEPNGDTVALFLTTPPCRLLQVRVVRSGKTPSNPPADALLSGLRQTEAGEIVPWCVFGFSWAVPRDLRLGSYRLEPGRQRFRFMSRRRRLSLERVRAPGAEASPAAQSIEGPGNGPIEHLGHPVEVRAVTGRRWWDRRRFGALWRATWTCPAAGRAFRIEADGKDAETLLRQTVSRVGCHQDETG